MCIIHSVQAFIQVVITPYGGGGGGGGGCMSNISCATCTVYMYIDRSYNTIPISSLKDVIQDVAD